MQSRGWMIFPGRAAAITLLALRVLSVSATAQDAENPSITFTKDFPGSNPDHFFVSVTADCRASYDSTARLADKSEDSDPLRSDLTVTPGTCKRIFDLAAKANYFEGSVDSRKKGIASTGIKTLAYKNGPKQTKATYNYSTVAAVRELTALFEALSETIEFGRRLEYDYHFQKLALEDELKKMEEEATNNQLVEVGAIAPILRKIAGDSSVMNVTRARAQRLIVAAGE